MALGQTSTATLSFNLFLFTEHFLSSSGWCSLVLISTKQPVISSALAGLVGELIKKVAKARGVKGSARVNKA